VLEFVSRLGSGFLDSYSPLPPFLKEARMRTFKFFLSFLLLSGTVAWSQVRPMKESTPSTGDFYVGGAYMGSNPASNFSPGIGGGVDVRVYKWIQAEADFSSFFATSGVANLTTTVDYLVGPRISAPVSHSRLIPFADFIVGGQTFRNGSTQHSYYYGNGSGLAFAGDGGVDIRLSKHLAFRGQAGFISSRYVTGQTTTTNTRFRAGTFLVYRF
jgi:hypothetical protein